MAKSPEGMMLFQAEVVSADGPCTAGHQVGDKLTLNCWDTGGLCGYFYHAIFPALTMMQFGGQYPWAAKDHLQVTCCDKKVNLTLKILTK